MIYHPDWIRLDNGLITENSVFQRILNNNDITKTDLAYSFSEIKKSLIDIPSTISLIEKAHLSNIPLYCLSNMSTKTYEYIKNREFFKYFSGIIISGKIKMIKPDLDIFNYAIKTYNLKPEETVFIDDCPNNINAAKSIGMRCVHFSKTTACYNEIESVIATA